MTRRYHYSLTATCDHCSFDSDFESERECDLVIDATNAGWALDPTKVDLCPNYGCQEFRGMTTEEYETAILGGHEL